jgi:hypothetical protein
MTWNKPDFNHIYLNVVKRYNDFIMDDNSFLERARSTLRHEVEGVQNLVSVLE